MKPRATDVMSSRFFVKDLPPSFRDEQLRDLLAPLGVVVRASVIITMSGESLPLAYVEMSKPDEAAKAVEASITFKSMAVCSFFTISESDSRSTPLF